MGVVKINVKTGQPEDVFVYYGEGQDETAGLAVKATALGNTMVVSGTSKSSQCSPRPVGVLRRGESCDRPIRINDTKVPAPPSSMWKVLDCLGG